MAKKIYLRDAGVSLVALALHFLQRFLWCSWSRCDSDRVSKQVSFQFFLVWHVACLNHLHEGAPRHQIRIGVGTQVHLSASMSSLGAAVIQTFDLLEQRIARPARKL